LIVEFFGPPGSGKTTFALALSDRLRKGGHPVTLRLSARPGEKSPGAARPGEDDTSAPLSAAARRLMGPAYELLVSAAQRPGPPSGGRVASVLTHALPRGQIFRSLRMRQYLVRLSNAWSQAARNRNVWIFDQAYIQAVASIVMVQPPMTDEAIAALLEVAPHCDLAIRVEAPPDDIETRLGRRRRQIGGVGRLFEETLGDVSDQAALAERIEGLLRRRRRQVLSLRSGDAEAMGEHVEMAEAAIVAMSNEIFARSS
jgi:DNA polymerase III delta prime subunit